MADGFRYGGFYPFWIPPPYPPHPPASTLPFLATHPVESSYDQTQGGYDPMIPHGTYHQTPSYDEDFPTLPPPSSSFYAQPGNFGPRREDFCKDMGEYYPSMETSSSNAVYYPPMARQRLVWAPYTSATVPSLADMLIRNSREPFYMPVPPSGVCASTNAFDVNRTGHYATHESMNAAAVSAPPVEPCVPSIPMSRLNTEGSFDGSTGSRSPWSSQPLNAKSSGSLFTEKGDASGVSSLYQRPNTLVSDSENGSSLKNAIGDLNCGDEHESLGAVKADTGNAAPSDVNYRTPSGGSEDVQGSQKTFKLQEQLVDTMNRVKKTMFLTDLSIKGSSLSNAENGQSPVCGRGSPAYSPRVSTVVNIMHILSEVLVNECFNNGSFLKPQQFEKLDIVVEKIAKCLKKITGDALDSTQAMHVSCPNVVDLNEAPIVVAKDCQGVNVQPLDSFGFKESVDKSQMTQSIKNILASNFPDGEENHPKTLLYKNLWLETEAALCSSTCLTRYHRIQYETGNLKLQDKEISADPSTLKQELFLNPQKLGSIMSIVEQETTESLIKDGSTSGNTVVTMSHDAPQSSRFNSAPVEAVLPLTGSLEPENHGNFKPAAQTLDTIQQESPSSTTEEKHNDVIDRFQILKHQETNPKLKSQETRMDEQEDNPDASEMATIGRSSHMSDVMGRFQILKCREAEQVQESLNSVDFDSDSYFESDSGSYFDSDSDNDQPRNKTQMYDHLCSGSMMAIGGNSKIETCANTEPSADGKYYESPTSDWEHVPKDD